MASFKDILREIDPEVDKVDIDYYEKRAGIDKHIGDHEVLTDNPLTKEEYDTYYRMRAIYFDQGDKARSYKPPPIEEIRAKLAEGDKRYREVGEKLCRELVKKYREGEDLSFVVDVWYEDDVMDRPVGEEMLENKILHCAMQEIAYIMKSCNYKEERTQAHGDYVDSGRLYLTMKMTVTFTKEEPKPEDKK